MSQPGGPAAPYPQACGRPAGTGTHQRPRRSRPGARVGDRRRVRSGRARGERPVRLPAGRAVLHRGWAAISRSATWTSRRSSRCSPGSRTSSASARRRSGSSRRWRAGRSWSWRPGSRRCSARAGSAGCSPPSPRRAPRSSSAPRTSATPRPLDLLAWAAVLLCVTTALLRHRPRWWLGAGAAAGAGLENNNLMLSCCWSASLWASSSRSTAPVLRTEMAMARRWHRRGHLGAERHLAGHARVAAAGHGLRPAPAEHLPGRLPRRAAAQLVYLGLLVTPLTHRWLHQALADP